MDTKPARTATSSDDRLWSLTGLVRLLLVLISIPVVALAAAVALAMLPLALLLNLWSPRGGPSRIQIGSALRRKPSARSSVG